MTYYISVTVNHLSDANGNRMIKYEDNNQNTSMSHKSH